MTNIHTDKPPLNSVTAIFADGSQSFLLPQGATLEQIADRIDRLGTRHESETVAVVVKFAATAPQALPRDCPPRFAMDCWSNCPGFERLPDPWLVTPIGQMISCRKR